MKVCIICARLQFTLAMPRYARPRDFASRPPLSWSEFVKHFAHRFAGDRFQPAFQLAPINFKYENAAARPVTFQSRPNAIAGPSIRLATRHAFVYCEHATRRGADFGAKTNPMTIDARFDDSTGVELGREFMSKLLRISNPYRAVESSREPLNSMPRHFDLARM